MKTEIVEIDGTDRVIIIHPSELSFTPALTLTDAEYQAAADRVVIEAEAMGEHVLIRSKPSDIDAIMAELHEAFHHPDRRSGTDRRVK